jgi:threonine synthase
MARFQCRDCGQPYPTEIVHRCPTCGGIFEVADSIVYNQALIEPELPGIWKYRHSFGLPNYSPLITLGEGNTPLVVTHFQDNEIYLKLEYINPTGSFKDRLTAPEVSWLAAYQVIDAVEDSSGNAGASFAAYAARAGIHARVFVPAYASGPKREQIAAYGAEVIPVEGPRSAAAQAVLNAVAEGAVYASHAYLPFGLPGLATISYEIVEQLGKIPGTIITPAGHGSLMLGMLLGFIALQNAGAIKQIPKIIGVQVAACAPIWQMANRKISDWDQADEGETLAEGVRVKTPVYGGKLVSLIDEYPIQFTVISEEEILPGRDQLAHLGFYVETTSAIVWPAMIRAVDQLQQPIVLVLTGSGLKSYHP